MKVLSIEKIREADRFTIENEPIKSIDLMERAGTNCFKFLLKKVKKNQQIFVFAGLGNNGGDGLVVSRLMANEGFKVKAIIVRYSDKCSDDFQINYERLINDKKVEIVELKPDDNFPDIKDNDVVIDAIFGSGLSKNVTGFIGDVIEHINISNAFIVAIDIPSGLFADKFSDEKNSSIVKADYTLTIQFPKYSMFFAENDKFVGNMKVISIGLHPEFIVQVDVKNYFVEKEDFYTVLKSRNKFAHKGNFGHALLISGSYGKMGAAVLASKACFRTGVGLLTTHIPKKGYEIIQTATPETMVSIDDDEEVFSGIKDLSKYNVIGVGPGIGVDEKTQNALKLLIQNVGSPMVFDADAINIIGENKTWIPFIPKGSIFTPHPKEFERLTGKTNDSFERTELQRKFSIKNGVYIVLKGANTVTSCPDGSCFFNSTGNSGMATAGSGDALTGIILSLLAQNYYPKIAAIMGVFLHGLAGDIAADKNGMEAMIASDIINFLGEAYENLKS